MEHSSMKKDRLNGVTDEHPPKTRVLHIFPSYSQLSM